MFRRRTEHSLINCELIASEGEITSRWKRDKDLILFVLVGRSFELADLIKDQELPESFMRWNAMQGLSILNAPKDDS